ncbi:MAG: RNA-binding S4 domain-containing protein [Culturomica sp.]|jgi:ribosome-associated heat shock protein Hsp15|nr:RNA-binding S4 domain-containing protein [Culturomica sp.]
MDKIRIDKWLWAVRIFKTRSLATEQCNKGHVSIGDQKIKPSREVRVGEVIKVKMPPIEKSYKVKQLSDKRMSASLAVDFVEDVTPPEIINLLASVKMYGFEQRDRGIGRPTKRDRRMIDRLKEGEDL